MSNVTQLLQDIDQGDPHAAEKLLPLVYDELRRLAGQRMAQERPGQTLQPTALVHEAYLRLVGNADQQWNGRGHFFAAAAEAMRRILIEGARRRASQKRGGDRAREDISESLLVAPEVPEDLLALDEALTQLATTDPVAARLIELRYFAGLTSAEAAAVLGISPRKADRLWLYARTWLFERLKSD